MRYRNAVLLFVFYALLVACNGLQAEETVGAHFRSVLARIDAQCKKDKLGPYLDPSDPEYQEKRRDIQCDILKLKPYNPLATAGGRFAHSLKLPSPHDKPKNIWRDSMTGEEYFKALCEAEAGEWVFDRVNGVDGLFQARMFEPYPPSYHDVVFYSVEKGEMNVREPQDYMIQPYMGRYNFLELPAFTSSTEGLKKEYVRFFRNVNNTSQRTYPTIKDGRPVQVPYVVSQESAGTLKSKYGYTWRGVQRINAVENGIEGSELIVFNIKTKTVLAFRRHFTLYYPHPDSRDERHAARRMCPQKFREPPHQFIQNVLIPINK